MNIARALGDKFLKEEESAFSAEPHVSNVFKLNEDGFGLVVIARYFNLIPDLVHWPTSSIMFETLRKYLLIGSTVLYLVISVGIPINDSLDASLQDPVLIDGLLVAVMDCGTF